LRPPIIVIHVRQDQVSHEEELSKPEFRMLQYIYLNKIRMEEINKQKEIRFKALPGLSLIYINAVFILSLVACSPAYKSPDIGGLYNSLLQNESPYRNPVVLIPGLLGSKLVNKNTGRVVWGSFGLNTVSPRTAEGARTIALPMLYNETLDEMRDNVVSSGTLDRVSFNFLGYPLEQNTYAHILRILGIGGFRDQNLSEAGVINYGDRHFTCFQFDYDWRRDIVESAKKLDSFIKEKKKYVQLEIEKRFGIKDYDVKFDIVAHSMGGLVARYYLRYGSGDIPSDGEIPKVTWEGSKHVENLVMIGTPNAGSIDTFATLIEGFRPAIFLPYYPPAVLGTMPSLYELLPRSRHNPVLDENRIPIKDILDPELWIQKGWGLVNPGQNRVLSSLLHNIDSPDKRREIAIVYLRKVLNRARQFTTVMDRPAKPPHSLRMLLVAGDSERTNKTVQFKSNGELTVIETGPGDGTVLRSSALGDERLMDSQSSRLISPIQWSHVLFLFSNHLELTKHPAFTDNLLYFLLESQKN
jgi:pimeloyl-ACP methyl ester carboxylesterase